MSCQNTCSIFHSKCIYEIHIIYIVSRLSDQVHPQQKSTKDIMMELVFMWRVVAKLTHN